MEKKHDYQFRVVFDAIKSLIAAPDKKIKRVGVTAKESRARYRVLA